MSQTKQQYDFSPEKNQQLIKERGISFEEAIMAIEQGEILAIVPHPNTVKYPHQKMYVLSINNYAYVAPFVKKDKNTLFLKTIFPHRKLNKHYLRGGHHEKA